MAATFKVSRLVLFSISLTVLACGPSRSEAQEPCGDGSHCCCEAPVWHGSLFDRVRESVEVDLVYTNDSFLNAHGGVEQGGTNQGLVDLVLRTDLGAVSPAIGGSLVLHGQGKHGPSFQPYVGSTQRSNIDADPFVAMAEYYWERGLLDDTIILRAGRQVGAIQFSVMDTAADFTYGGFQKSPNNPIPWYPNPTVAVTADVLLTDELRLNVGAFNGGTPDQLSTWGWSQEGKVYNVAELNYGYAIDEFTGDVKLGAWYESGTHDTPDGLGVRSGNHGFYAGWQQLLIAECDDETQGLAVFGIFSYAPENRNAVNHHVATGLVYRGLIEGRDADVTGGGVSFAEFSDLLPGRDTETTVEVFHKLTLCDHAYLEPTLQHVSAPGGVQADCLIVGLRFGLDL